MHKCIYDEKKKNHFVCTGCSNKHICGDKHCDQLSYNTNQTRVCQITGICFGQRLCEEYSSSRNGIQHSDDPVYKHKLKRNQQIKNSILKRVYVTEMVDSIETIPKLSPETKKHLIKQILALWETYKQRASSRLIEIQRNDQRCFIVAIMFSLHKGLCSYSSKLYIITPHENLTTRVINKKKSYSKFNVSDITDGQKKIKRVFEDFELKSPISIN